MQNFVLSEILLYTRQLQARKPKTNDPHHVFEKHVDERDRFEEMNEMVPRNNGQPWMNVLMINKKAMIGRSAEHAFLPISETLTTTAIESDEHILNCHNAFLHTEFLHRWNKTTRYHAVNDRRDFVLIRVCVQTVCALSAYTSSIRISQTSWQSKLWYNRPWRQIIVAEISQKKSVVRFRWSRVRVALPREVSRHSGT